MSKNIKTQEISAENISHYAEIIKFRNNLNDIEQEIQNEIRALNGVGIKSIGISIQLWEEEQDENTPTRGQKADINDYCKSIQEFDNCEKCDKFDIQAKRYSKFFHQDTKNILFNCHANVTNYLLPFKPNTIDEYLKYSYNGPLFYVFFGHFLQNESFKLSIDENTNLFNPSIISDTEKQEYNLLREFIPKTESFKSNNGTEYNTPISTASQSDYLAISKFAKTKIVKKLIDRKILIIDSTNNELKPSDELIKYIDRIEPEIILKNIELIKNSIDKTISITKEEKSKIIEIITQIELEVNKSKSNLEQIIKDVKSNGKNLFQHLSNNVDGIINSIDNDIYKKYSLIEINKFIKYCLDNSFDDNLAIRNLEDIFERIKTQKLEDYKFINKLDLSYRFKKVLNYLSNIKLSCNSIFTLDPKWYEYVGVLSLAIAGNLLYQNIVNNVSLKDWIYFFIFSIAGFSILSFSYYNELVSRDFFRDKSIRIKRSKYVYIRLRSHKFKLILFFALTVFIPISEKWVFNQNNVENFKQLFTDPHTQSSFEVYNNFATDQGIYKAQSKFLTEIIRNNSKDTLTVVEALGVNLENYNIIVDYDSTKTIYYNMYSEDVFKDRDTQSINFKNKKWNVISTDDLSNVDLLFLFNNTIAELNDEKHLKEILKSYYTVLSKNGILVLDVYDVSEPSVFDTRINPKNINGIGISRSIENINKTHYSVQFDSVDLNKISNHSKELLKRKHCKKISDPKFLKSELEKIGFKNVTMQKIDNYPFVMISASK